MRFLNLSKLLSTKPSEEAGNNRVLRPTIRKKQALRPLYVMVESAAIAKSLPIEVVTTFGWSVAMPEIDHAGLASTITVTLGDGRRLETRVENGMLEPGELEEKFLRLTRSALGEAGAVALFERLQRLEDEARLDWLS